MSSEFNDMERMFADSLRDYEVTPPAHVWSNIQKRKRKGLLFYKWRIASSLLLLCLAGTSAYYFINENNKKLNDSKISKTAKNNTISSLDNPPKKGSPNQEDYVSQQPTNTNLENSTSFDNANIITKSTPPALSKHASIGETTKNNDPVIENTVFDTKDLVFRIAAKNNIRLKYIIYPSLMQFVYTSKKLGKRIVTPKKPIEDDELGYKFSIEFGGGPSYAFRKLSGNGVLLRNESEKALLGLQTGIKVNYHINSKWSIQTGLTLENRNEKIKYNRIEIKEKLTETPRQVTIFHPVLPPRTITVVDSNYSEENIEYKFNTTNKYQIVSIPTVLGYNFGVGKLQYRVSAGALFNIYSMNSAFNLVKNGEKIELIPYTESTKIKTSVF
ncbi:MAG: hypothetical protein ACKVQB_13205, partial [Bacteroidia bacterium]